MANDCASSQVKNQGHTLSMTSNTLAKSFVWNSAWGITIMVPVCLLSRGGAMSRWKHLYYRDPQLLLFMAITLCYEQILCMQYA